MSKSKAKEALDKAHYMHTDPARDAHEAQTQALIAIAEILMTISDQLNKGADNGSDK